MLRCKARDEGRSPDYDAEERNAADGHFSCKPGWGGCRDTVSEAWGAGAAA